MTAQSGRLKLPNPLVGSSDRALAICCFLAERGTPASLSEICRELGLAKGTAHRLCTRLLDSGFLERDMYDQKFTVGPLLRRQALNILNNSIEKGLRRGVLSRLSKEVKETCNLTTLDGSQVLYLDRVEANWPVRLSIDVGTHVPLHCTSSGKLLLANMPSRKRRDLAHKLPLERYTDATIIEPNALLAECKMIVNQGYAVDSEEFVPGLISFAVPIHDSEDTVRATLSLHAPIARMSLDEALVRLDVFHRAAREMSEFI